MHKNNSPGWNAGQKAAAPAARHIPPSQKEQTMNTNTIPGGLIGRAIPPIIQELAMPHKTKAAVAAAAHFDPFMGSFPWFDNSTFVLVAQGGK